MELVYVTRAIKRYWWISALGAVLGLLAGMFVGAGGGDVYSSQALVLISPPSDGGLGSTSTDRYVQNQLLVFGSGALADQVATSIDAEGLPVSQWSTFEQVPGSDMVRITVAAPSAELSRDVANGYVDQYLDAVRNQLDDAQAPDLEAINEALAEVDAAIDAVDQQIEVALADFPRPGPEAPLPTIEQASPTLATQRQVLLDQYIELLRNRNEMELGAEMRASSQVIQRAGLPSQPDPSSVNLLLFAAPLAGVMFGAIISVLLARSSSRVLDIDEVEEILEHTVAATIPRERSLVKAHADLGRAIPPSIQPVVHELCVRSEASDIDGAALVVVVAGAEEASGTTTLALSMSRTFAELGSEVVLLDMDLRDPELSTVVNEGMSGVHYMAAEAGGSDGTRRPSRTRLPVVGTILPGVRFAGQGDRLHMRALRRDEVPRLVARASEYGSIVVIDAGTLMDAASSVQLAQLADAVVLTVPVRRQRRGALRVCARQLLSARGTILPVATFAGVRRDRSEPPARQTTPSPEERSTEPEGAATA